MKTLKNRALDTPEPIATVEKTMAAGKTHHNCEKVYMGLVRSLCELQIHHDNSDTRHLVQLLVLEP